MIQSRICVRRARLSEPADADAFTSLLNAYAADPMGRGKPLAPELLERTVNDLRNHPTAHIWLADHLERPAGFATAFLGYSTFKAAPLLNIHDLAVLPEHRGNGIARFLLTDIDATAKSLGCCKLTLEVRGDNRPAQSLYRAVGFRENRQPDGSSVPYYFLELNIN